MILDNDNFIFSYVDSHAIEINSPTKKENMKQETKKLIQFRRRFSIFETKIGRIFNGDQSLGGILSLRICLYGYNASRKKICNKEKKKTKFDALNMNIVNLP